MNDHCDGSSEGGIAVFSAGVYGTYERTVLPEDSFCPKEAVIIRWDRSVNHAMTFAGYNDSIRYDYNGDGKYTNDIDTNGDGIVDMKDWEIGGLLMVNSWGENWADEGKSWVMYRTLAQDLYSGGIYNNICHTVRIKENVKPTLKLKSTIACSDRDNIRITAGISQEPNAFEPRYSIGFPLFNYQGGDSIGIEGSSDIIELGLDISNLLDLIPEGEGGTLFLSVTHTGDTLSIGKVISFSVIDHEGTEFTSLQKNVDIKSNNTTHVGLFMPQPFKITTEYLPAAVPNETYNQTLTAEKGTTPYKWDIVINYTETEITTIFPSETFQEISMTNSDDGYGIINLDFPFPFFDKLYSSITVTSNGAITFNGIYESVKTADDISKTKTIAPCAADFDKADVTYFGNDNYVIIVWDTSITGTGTSGTGNGNGGGGGGVPPTSYFNFAAKLFSDGTIEFYYGDVTAGKYYPSGISNGTALSTYITKVFNYWDPSGFKTSFIKPPYPYGIELSEDGVFNGNISPTDETTWDIIFRANDSNNLIAVKELTFSIVDLSMTLASPNNLRTETGEISSVIRWDAVPGATMYHIYRSTDPYQGFIKIGTATSLSYEDMDFSNEERCFYYVTADNSKR
ncbi:MAG: hypothetical protein JXR69_00565 [Candidatus Delongbacteria bacterium]|nr:hypothetical protein [Candidatus Delongbacteria bacterium]